MVIALHCVSPPSRNGVPLYQNIYVNCGCASSAIYYTLRKQTSEDVSERLHLELE